MSVVDTVRHFVIMKGWIWLWCGG